MATPMSVLHLVQSWFARKPEAVALEVDATAMTYADLDARSADLAAFLRLSGVEADACVALLVDRSVEAFVGALGILRAGGACVPLDPAWPAPRLALMLEDCRASLVLTRPHLRSLLPATQVPVVDLGHGAVAPPSAGVGQAPGPDSLAYVIYTSGSTGRPKGVAMVHRALVELVRWQNECSPLALRDGDGVGVRTAAFSSLSFDVSFQEMLTTWSSGGTLVVASEEERRDPRALLRLLRDRDINRLYLPYVALRQLAEAAESEQRLPLSLRDVITAGEQLKVTPRIADFFRRLPGARLHNHYGPSETHVVTAWTLPAEVDEWPDLPPIGYAIRSARLHLLDSETLQPVPEGEAGEIFIGGDCLARGYLHRPDLTRERFVPSPFPDEPGARLYRTGDLGRKSGDGCYEFLGRADDQVKIRGYRVEPGEVETLLSSHPDVLDCAVVPRPGREGDPMLVAYVLSRPGAPPSSQVLRQHLRGRAPDYMIPSAFVFMDAFPQTPSGKVDRRNLPSPLEVAPPQSRPLVAARSDLERLVLEAWQEVLGTSLVSLVDDFSELGGTSLQFVKILRRLEDSLGHEIRVVDAFRHNTPETLARFLAGDAPASPTLSSTQERAARQKRAFGRTAPRLAPPPPPMPGRT